MISLLCAAAIITTTPDATVAQRGECQRIIPAHFAPDKPVVTEKYCKKNPQIGDCKNG